ncbi:MAG: class I SAM-dependent methyltransferase [Actinomycetota bacterium]|nr:class I SAM-dependent methyltransferase [Actinomycetota bacterium]
MDETGPGFEFEEAFDDDYLYFYEPRLTPERSDADADLITRLLDLEPGMAVLDVACGHGRIANRLAARGCAVTGIDRTARFLELARREAAEAGISVEYVQGDMRSLPWRDRFDRVISWFTSWGYFDDEGNRRVLHEMYAALKPGGRLILEHLHRDNLFSRLERDTVTEREGNYMIDRHRFDALAGRMNDERIIVRDGRVRRFSYFVRLLAYTELRDWLREVGFVNVTGYGSDGTPLALASTRMLVTASKETCARRDG